jgi:hypothetical protein
METFAILGFIFGLFALTSVSNTNKKIKELEKRMNDLEAKC